MSKLTTAYSIKNAWLKPVAARTQARIRHAGDFGAVVQPLPIALRPDDEPTWAGDAVWLRDLCVAQAGGNNLIRIGDEMARNVT